MCAWYKVDIFRSNRDFQKSISQARISFSHFPLILLLFLSCPVQGFHVSFHYQGYFTISLNLCCPCTYCTGSLKVSPLRRYHGRHIHEPSRFLSEFPPFPFSYAFLVRVIGALKVSVRVVATGNVSRISFRNPNRCLLKRVSYINNFL